MIFPRPMHNLLSSPLKSTSTTETRNFNLMQASILSRAFSWDDVVNIAWVERKAAVEPPVV
jgi:hypothetical protein